MLERGAVPVVRQRGGRWQRDPGNWGCLGHRMGRIWGGHTWPSWCLHPCLRKGWPWGCSVGAAEGDLRMPWTSLPYPPRGNQLCSPRPLHGRGVGRGCGEEQGWDVTPSSRRTTHSPGGSPAQQPGEGGVSPKTTRGMWGIGLISQRMQEGSIPPSSYAWIWSDSFPRGAESKPAPGNTVVASLGVQQHPWGRGWLP